jgi:hypothetical protein
MGAGVQGKVFVTSPAPGRRTPGAVTRAAFQEDLNAAEPFALVQNCFYVILNEVNDLNLLKIRDSSLRSA